MKKYFKKLALIGLYVKTFFSLAYYVTLHGTKKKFQHNLNSDITYKSSEKY